MRNVHVARGMVRDGRWRKVGATLAVTFRAAEPADAEALARAVIAGFEIYREFSPPGWEPPPVADEIELQRGLLAEETTWCRLAESGGRIVGQVTFLPAARAAEPVEEPGLAHMRNLFVDREHWGSGLARDLHDAAIEAARERGFSRMRLFTPARHGRARRFYEREGWVQAGDEFHAPGPDMVIVEYRNTLRMAG
jgi:GNAT superfamily N-acetyltransferase